MRERGGQAIGRLLVSLLAFGVVAVAIPAGLIAVSRNRFGSANPLAGVPAAAPSGLDQPVADHTVIDVLIRLSLCAIWIAVAVIVVTTVVEVVHMVRHRGLSVPSVRGLGWAQGIARFIAVGLFVVIPVATSSPSLASSVNRAPPIVSTLDPPANVTRQASSGPTEATVPTAATAPTPAPIAAATSTHLVRPGESVYSIAQQLAGRDSSRVIEIAEGILDANLGAEMGPGQRFTNPAYIEVGWVLQIPVGSAASVEVPAPVPSPPITADAAATETAPDTYEVQPGDTLWDIAAEQLGDPTEWPDIWDANAGADMGGGRSFDDPNLILPGWELRLDDAPGEGSTTDEPPTFETTSVATDAADNATIEAPEVDDESAGDAIATAAEEVSEGDDGTTVTTGATPADAPWPADADADANPREVAPPAAERAGGTVSAPAMPTTTTLPAATTASTTTAASLSTTATSSTTSTTVPVGATGGEAGTVDGPPSPAGSTSPIRLEHAALLAAGILALVAVRRRQRLRAAMPRHRVPEPRPEAVETERRLRSIDAGERALRVDVACRAAAAELLDTGARIGWVAVTADGEIHVRLTSVATLPPPWSGDMQDWRLAADVPIELLGEQARKVGMPCVALVQLGVTASGAEILVDLEACGTLAVDADPAVADEVVTALAAGLAASMYAEVAHLIVSSLCVTALLGHRNGHHVASVDAALELAHQLAGTTLDNERTTFELRSLRTGGEMWEPAVVLLTGEDNASHTLDALPEPGHGLAIVAATSTDGLPLATSRLVEQPDGWRLTAFGTTVALRPIGLSAQDLKAIDDVLIDASRKVESVELDSVAELQWADDDEAAAEEFVPMDHRVVVGLLGGVEVAGADGTTGRFERSKTVELIAWLATHRERATRTGARTALWELDVRDATFANVVSEARRGLARLAPPPEGEEWVARTLTEQLPLHAAVVTDADLVAERLDHARVQPPAQAIETLRPAVAMIRDIPFAGTSYLWPDAEGITSNLVLLAITAAAEFAGHALSLGDTDGVFWATGQGLRVLPGHEELIGLRMRAHARSGDLAGVRQEWESYERVLVADAWSDGEPAPKLLALRRELLAASAN